MVTPVLARFVLRHSQMHMQQATFTTQQRVEGDPTTVA
jgi:hypothetical protein